MMVNIFFFTCHCDSICLRGMAFFKTTATWMIFF
jgi:hypothetical protein